MYRIQEILRSLNDATGFTDVPIGGQVAMILGVISTAILLLSALF